MDGHPDVRLPAMFDDLDVGITLHHPETGAILDVNDSLGELYGYSPAELRDMTVGDFTAPSTKFSQDEAVRRIRAAADGESDVFEWQVERKNGELIWVNVHLNPSTVDGTRCVVAEIHDVTEFRERERRLRLLSRIVRHNLRNEMTLLMGYAERLKEAVDEESLEDEVETILEIAREVGTLSDSVRQIEHNDRDAPSVTVTVTDDPDDDRGVVRVADDGPPIPDVETAVLDGDEATSTTHHGSGVGLWVMQWCVDSLGGELTFAENDPRGNVVAISLPRVVPPDEA